MSVLRSFIASVQNAGDEADSAAFLAVKSIQTGQDPQYFLELAGLRRAVYYELKDTYEILRPEIDKRMVERLRWAQGGQP